MCSIKCVEAAVSRLRPESPSGPPSPLCARLGAGLRAPDFWSRDLAVTASDDRGSGEIAPRTPEEAHISGGHSTHSAQTVPIARPLFWKNHGGSACVFMFTVGFGC